jgi:rhodanese-related sulfurtransferase
MMHHATSRLSKASRRAAALALIGAARDLTAATAAWDDTKAAQAMIVLAGFVVVLFVSLVLLARTVSRLRRAPRVDVGELKRRLDDSDDLLLLDVRTAADFVGEQGHIADATNIPLESLPSRLHELAAHRDRPIALVCRTDRRSDQAAALLAGRGFSRVSVVEGGMTAWLRNRWPVEDAQPPAP